MNRNICRLIPNVVSNHVKDLSRIKIVTLTILIILININKLWGRRMKKERINIMSSELNNSIKYPEITEVKY